MLHFSVLENCTFTVLPVECGNIPFLMASKGHGAAGQFLLYWVLLSTVGTVKSNVLERRKYGAVNLETPISDSSSASDLPRGLQQVISLLRSLICRWGCSQSFQRPCEVTNCTAPSAQRGSLVASLRLGSVCPSRLVNDDLVVGGGLSEDVTLVLYSGCLVSVRTRASCDP